MRARRTFPVPAPGVAVLLLVWTSACGPTGVTISLPSGPAFSSPSASPSPGETAATPSGAVSPAPSPTGLPTFAPITPEIASLGLYGAWRTDNRQDAAAYATPEAVEELFSTPYPDPGPAFDGCVPEDGQFDCIYRYEGGTLTMVVEGDAETGFAVVDVVFAAD